MSNDVDDLSEFAPVGDPEDGGIFYQPVDPRDFFNFAEYAEAYFHHTRRKPENDEDTPSPLDLDGELVEKMARRYAVQILGYDARHLAWHATPGTVPVEAHHDLDGTDHRLLYRPHRVTGEFQIVLERHCRFHVDPEYFTLSSLAELGALLSGKDADR